MAWFTSRHLRPDCLYTGISSGPNARLRVWENFTFYCFIFSAFLTFLSYFNCHLSHWIWTSERLYSCLVHRMTWRGAVYYTGRRVDWVQIRFDVCWAGWALSRPTARVMRPSHPSSIQQAQSSRNTLLILLNLRSHCIKSTQLNWTLHGPRT